MSLRDQFATNQKTEVTGHPVEFGKNDDGTTPTFIVARMSKANKPYMKALERAMKPLQRQIQLKTLDNDVAGAALLTVFCETVLKGWSNVKQSDLTEKPEDSTKDLPFTVANAKALMDALPDLYDELNTQANDASNYRDGTMEESAKNS